MIQEQNLYYLRGSQGSPVTLTASFVASSVILARLKRTLTLKGTYTPAENNSTLYMLIETSDDPIDAVASQITHWNALDTSVAGTNEVDLFADTGTSMSTRAGIPVIIPGDKTSAAATAIAWRYQFPEEVAANWVRVSFKEVTAGAFGTTDCEAVLTT